MQKFELQKLSKMVNLHPQIQIPNARPVQIKLSVKKSAFSDQVIKYKKKISLQGLLN